jgi:hypothetical protein
LFSFRSKESTSIFWICCHNSTEYVTDESEP